jgi:hypothetical protein
LRAGHLQARVRERGARSSELVRERPRVTPSTASRSWYHPILAGLAELLVVVGVDLDLDGDGDVDGELKR